MTSYTIQNTAGSTVATINPATTTGVTFPIVLPGQGLSLYGQIIDQNLYQMLENFAKTTAPINPVTGQWWYNSTTKIPNYWNGAGWIGLATAANSMTEFPMAGGATNVDFTASATTVIFTHPGGSVKYYPTGIMLFPKSVVSVTTPAAFSLQCLVADDVMETVLITAPTTTKFAFWSIDGMTQPVSSGNSISLAVTSPATGGGGLQLKYDVALFGLIA